MDSGRIYLIRPGSGGVCKIGWSRDPAKRLAEIQTGNHLPLRVVLTFPGDPKDELGLHGLHGMQKVRWRGEWFALSSKIISSFRERRSVTGEPVFDRALGLEPQLWEPLASALLTVDDLDPRGYCGNSVWYKTIKPQILPLVGMVRRDDGDAWLRSAEAYTGTYKTLYELMPDCRSGPRCGCAWWH